MLTADLVNARRVRNELRLIPLDGERRARAVELAQLYLQVAQEHVGRARDELDESLDRLECEPGEKRTSDGLKKLIEDDCEFDALSEDEPPTLRQAIFERAAARRKASTADAPFSREAVLTEIAAELGRSTDEIERLLYADLRGAQVLRSVPAISPAALVDKYEESQAQGILLRAVKVVVDVQCASAVGYRYLFRKIKFLRLLATIEPHPDEGYRITLDGPFSMFESTTRYGLQLALLLPHILQCQRYRLTAEVRWGKERTPLTFRMEGGQADATHEPASELPEETVALMERIRSMETAWAPSVNQDILTLPGAGLCVPDLRFEHRESGQCVYLEVMGFWSRPAVWKRVELVEQGLPYRILFAVSERLRVSEQALGEDAPGALYVYKGVMNARAVLERLDVLASR